MLSFFRRIINSRTGVIVAFIVLGVIALAFAAGDVTGLRNVGPGSTANAATVGGASISVVELEKRVQDEMQAFRQQQPTLDLAQFVNGGGFEGTLERMINSIALEQFGNAQGMRVSKQVVDGEIASIPSLQGPDGKFSQTVYERLLQQRKLTDPQIRAEIARGILTNQLTAPTVGASQVPDQLALPYASLLLEKRSGQLGFVPYRAMGAGDVPKDAELTTFYSLNRARYTIPERRVIRYALISPDRVKQAAIPTETEIVAAYQQQASRFAASQKRTLSQVVIGDKTAAEAFAAKVKSGTAIVDAAKAIGLDAAKITGVDRKGYAGQTSSAIAGAVFGVARGAVVGPLQAPLGWSVIQVDSIEQVPAKSLDQARPELAKELGADKAARAFADLHDRIDDAISNKATFAEIVADQKLQPVTTPALLADGRNVEQPEAKPDPALGQIIKAGFAAETGDDPQLVPAGADGTFAVVSLERVVPAAAPPAVQLREVLLRDFTIDRARRKARIVATQLVAQVNKGLALADALAQTKLSLAPVQKVATSRAALVANPNGAPPPLALMFAMKAKTAKLLEAPEQGGWLIVYLDQIEAADATGKPAVINAMRADIGKTIGRELVQQFSEAVRRQVGVTKHEAAIAKARQELLGQAGAQP